MNRPEITFDDYRQVATINGVDVTYELLVAFTEPTPESYWFRVFRDESNSGRRGMMCIERKVALHL